jgi:hypothetical protein
MILEYKNDDMDLIQKINIEIFGLVIEREKLLDELFEIKKNKTDFLSKSPIVYQTQMDNTLSKRVDLLDKLNNTPARLRDVENGENPYDTTMRFGKDSDGKPIIRIPPSFKRVPLYKDDIIPENYAGYLVLLNKFMVCEFQEADIVLRDSGCKPETIRKRKDRLSKIYKGIEPDDIISIYLIDHFVDERYLPSSFKKTV